MLYFFDESGIDLKESPCRVLAAVAIAEDILWKFITESIELKKNILAMPHLHAWEPKGKTLLKRKKFKFANQRSQMSSDERLPLLKSLYKKNESNQAPRSNELTALGQASLEYVSKLLDLCAEFNIKVFASVVPKNAIHTKGAELQKDYTYLFQRMYLHLISISSSEKGIIVFDEVDKAIARILIKQMRRYFLYTRSGRERSKRIIPEPFFVHSDLTTATQLVDIIAYIINYGFQKFAREKIIKKGSRSVKTTTFRRKEPVRKEILPFAQKIFDLQFHKIDKDRENIKRAFYSIVYIKDLRTRFEKLGFKP